MNREIKIARTMALKKISTPIIREITYDNAAITDFEKNFEQDKNSKYLLRYPTIYIVNDKIKPDKYSVYVGETNNIKRRTTEHLQDDSKTDNFWQKVEHSNNSKIFLIGHDHFNKSLTLDIENKLMHYMTGVDAVELVKNGRSNQQDEYYTSDELDPIFIKIWRKLREKNKQLFPLLSVIQDSAIFKASPFHKLTPEQIEAKDTIILKIEEALNRNRTGQLILVKGEAGAGKTVLLSNLFYELTQLSANESDNSILRGKTQNLLVNHDQQLKVYTQIADKLGIRTKANLEIVEKPTKFINDHLGKKVVDVVLVDEAHLLWTQGKQSYRGENQLDDLLKCARVVVAVFDPHQILSREQYWGLDKLNQMTLDAMSDGNFVELHNQLRIAGNQKTVDWIRSLTDEQRIKNIPADNKYDLHVFDSPQELYEVLKQKSLNEEAGISRLLATFDWKYIDKKKPNDSEYWNVTVGDFSMPWNLQLPQTKEVKRRNKSLAWAEQEQTIGEVGSTFTIQGFDLNYAGVIIGPSVKYRDGKIVFDKQCSQNSKATQRRTYEGQKVDASDTLLKNELNVLLTRGVHGLYLYAVDDQLQQKLLEAQKGIL
ncbi:DUF2075 domain-containing protein [Companilactobacillus nantensis]|nr:DUF2075 domain-containing protein [Companilactobacillus nantensis]GEO65363.1 hypothetical protein LNA01_25460 [Companilactobacillus nantensis]